MVPNRGMFNDTKTGNRSYYYKIETVVCEEGDTWPCPADDQIAVGDDTGCFYVYWNEDV